MASNPISRKGGSTKCLYSILIIAVLCWCLNLILLTRLSLKQRLVMVENAKFLRKERKLPLGGKGMIRPVEKSTERIIEKSVLEPQAVFSVKSNKEDSSIGQGDDISKEKKGKTLAQEGANDVEEEKKSAALKLHTPTSPYAYSWVMGAVHEDRPAYKGFLYDVLISANLLKKLGSTADLWLWVQMSPESNLNTLPGEDLRLLNEVGIHVQTVPKPNSESFANLVYDKFRTLQMTKYKRVIFLDADIIPLVNIDYIFHLSDPEHNDSPHVLRPNFIMASKGEPCNTGMFMVEPKVGAWEALQQVINKQHESARHLPYPHFSWEEGWGHNFEKEGDKWEGIIHSGVRWHFHAGHSDQGLMYYYAKYVAKDVSIAIGNKVQNWQELGEAKKPSLQSEGQVLQPYSPEPIAFQESCNISGKDILCDPPYRDFAHFMGNSKPWQNGVQKPWMKTNTSNTQKKNAPYRLWFDELSELNEKLRIGLDIKNWDDVHMKDMEESPLGYMAMYKDHTHEVMGSDSNGKHLTDTKEQNSTSQDITTVAYAVSFIKCGDHQNNAVGLVDASLVLRHSIHKISSRNAESGSKYDYKMYAIVHKQAEACSSLLKDTGFEVVIVDPPINQDEIRGQYLRENIHKERCCGHDEFIKLYAYTLPEDIIVHVDIDFAFYKPIDHLFDAIKYSKNSPEGKAAREKIELERPDERLPDEIGAFVTRDWTQVVDAKFPPPYQAGFLVARRDPSVMTEMIEVIKEGNYTYGWGWKYGWGNKGYGGYVGAMVC